MKSYTPVKCVKCSHEWKYKGIGFYVTCPKCRNMKKLNVVVVGEVVKNVEPKPDAGACQEQDNKVF
jgi:DNA-directed RNA polymerase subunit RPC12/RpoP